ncbi:MAG: S1 RNA-binding domain-containing protein [Cyanobacteriota bacterium]
MRNVLTVEDQKLVDEFEKLLNESYDYSFNIGDVVKGEILVVDKGGLVVDVGAKSEAFVPFKEISNVHISDPSEVVSPGDQKEFIILKDDDEDGRLTLSLKRVALARSWDELEELKKEGDIISARVASVVKGGVVVDVLGLRGFVPASQLRAGGPYDNIIGQEIPMKILETDRKRNKLILSQRQAIAEQRAKILEEVIDDLKEEQVVEGEVVRIADFGAFIDIKGIDGLLPISEMSWQRVRHPADLLKIGQRITVKVLKIDRELNRISLSLKRMEEDPWVKIEGQFTEGQIIDGTVNKITQFGAFVDIFPGVEALLPVSEIADEQVDPEEHLTVGERITVVIKRFTPAERRISLSIKGVKEAQNNLNSVEQLNHPEPVQADSAESLNE